MRETIGPRPDEDPVAHYLSVIDEKTGSLIATAGRFGGMFAGAADEHVQSLRRFGEVVGAAFQISDDVIDIASPADESGKTPGTDLREGVHTLPILYALRRPGDPTASGCASCWAGRSPTTPRSTRRSRCCASRAGLSQARGPSPTTPTAPGPPWASFPTGPARDALDSLTDYVVDRTY